MDKIIEMARSIHKRRYAEAAVVFAAGSIVRGEGTPYSDLDLVVVYPRLAHAYRESFRFEGCPVEAFVHDPETLNYFFLENDRPSGIPALPQMVAEGVEIPGPSDFSISLKSIAASVIAMGPPPLSAHALDRSRYMISDLLDDLRSPRSREESLAAGARLFESLADYHLRSHGLWSAGGKAIPRALGRADADLRDRYCRAFDRLFASGDAEPVIRMAEELLLPGGGVLFEGYRADAPTEWRKPICDATAEPGSPVESGARSAG
jgi:hypothetical protein